MARIREVGFGYIVIDGRRFSHDVVLLPDGRIVPRPKELSKPYRHVYGHTPLSGRELEEILRLAGGARPEALIIGAGVYGAMPVAPDARRLLEELAAKGTMVIIDKTLGAAETYNTLVERGVRVLAVLHTTC